MSTYSNRLQPALQNLLQHVQFFHPRSSCMTHIVGRFQRTKITRKASDVAENLQLYWVVRFFHPRSSCTTTHISADVQRTTLNASYMTVSGGRTKQLDIFWLYKWFSQFHSCGTYSVLSRNPSVVTIKQMPGDTYPAMWSMAVSPLNGNPW